MESEMKNGRHRQAESEAELDSEIISKFQEDQIDSENDLNTDDNLMNPAVNEEANLVFTEDSFDSKDCQEETYPNAVHKSSLS